MATDLPEAARVAVGNFEVEQVRLHISLYVYLHSC
jgi:hypothetical protein